MGMIQGIEPCTIHRLLRYAPRRASDGSLQQADAASEEATLGEEGAFEYGRWVGVGWEGGRGVWVAVGSMRVESVDGKRNVAAAGRGVPHVRLWWMQVAS